MIYSIDTVMHYQSHCCR